ncbi:glycosyltransferase family 39 protein [Actinacidiphila soli]|uniref:glycosyltransferase family 39 protein n=1 Tax=Actinacidiphila soli TaxID=2487275 RepID=UPI000FCC8A6A|nr:glycosyltransferase family 39 protein [Actinacidiphila soli]
MNREADSWFSPTSPPPAWVDEHGGPVPYYPPAPVHVQVAPPVVPDRYEPDQYLPDQYLPDPYEAEPAEEKAAYEIPETPETGWSGAPSRRRRWIGRIVLAGVLLIQAALSLSLGNTADFAEAASLVLGRQELDHLLNGLAVTTDLVHGYPGSPSLYPVLAGAAEKVYGLTGARLLSLLFALAATALVYSLTRRLFNERVAICGAGAYAVLQSTVVVGYYVSPDALAILLVAFAVWIVVYTNRAPVAAVLAAAPVAALAAAVEHAAVLVLPTLLLLAVLTSWPLPTKGLLRGLLLGAGTLGLLTVTGALSSIRNGTFARGQGTESALAILTTSAQWSGLFLLVACGGAVAYLRRARMYEVVDAKIVDSAPLRRAALGLTLCATAVLVPLLQAQLHTSAAMFRHIGLGLLFAAPLAGVGITRMVGAHFRQPQLGILVWVLMLALGISQSTLRFESWPDSTPLVGVLRAHVSAKGHYLSEVEGVPQYYLRDVTAPTQWTSVRALGAAGTAAAVKKGYFGLIVLDSGPTATEDKAVTTALTTAIRSSARYRLIAQLPYHVSGGSGTYRVYVKQ